MERWNKIFKINKSLDCIFMSKYGSDANYYEKNAIELTVEIAELANETKCFKYWSNKSCDKEKVLEEYADAITMTLSFYTIFDYELEYMNHYDTDNILELFNVLLKDSTYIFDKNNKELIKNIFSNLLYLGKLLEFSDEEIYDACYKKMKIVEERLNSDY